MNRALNIKNWKNGGNNYILKGNPKNRWVGFQETVIRKLQQDFNTDFNIVIWTDEMLEYDYYCIPFSAIAHLFQDTHKTSGKYPDRWTAVIIDHKFLMHGNRNLSVDLLPYYSIRLIPLPTIQVEEDYYIENARREINTRIGQSKFRKAVLKNFDYKCALTGISETALLNASHIIPWSNKKEFRGDPSNGLCLYIEYDVLFDKGFISFSDYLEVIIPDNCSIFSPELNKKLTQLKGIKLNPPRFKAINPAFLEYHRKNIFQNHPPQINP